MIVSRLSIKPTAPLPVSSRLSHGSRSPSFPLPLNSTRRRKVYHIKLSLYISASPFSQHSYRCTTHIPSLISWPYIVCHGTYIRSKGSTLHSASTVSTIVQHHSVCICIRKQEIRRPCSQLGGRVHVQVTITCKKILWRSLHLLHSDQMS